MRFRFIPTRRPAHQAMMPFVERTRRLDWIFKRAIVLATLGVVGLVFAASPRLRFLTVDSAARARQATIRWIVGAEPTEEEIAARREARRAETARRTRESLEQFYDRTTPEMQAMFRAASMDPEHCLIGTGRADNGFLLSSAVFEADDRGRSYRLRPNVRSVWLRQVTLIGGPFGLFLVPDTPEVRAAAGAAGAIVDETSRQTTNAWGLRGPEPDPSAPIRGVILGDSFMQGMFNDDDHTPPLDLERALEACWGRDVSLVNTGHIGYAPEQYYHALVEYGERFDPHFVVVSVCPNDFGDEYAVLAGKGSGWDEAEYWLGKIGQWCRTRMIPCLTVAVPIIEQINGTRDEREYPARITDIHQGTTAAYLNPFEQFLDAHLRLIAEDEEARQNRSQCVLYNYRINDNHFSPRGSKLWAEIVARRLDGLMNQSGRTPERTSTQEREDGRVIQPGGEPVGLAQPPGRAVLVGDRHHERPRRPRRGDPGGAVLQDQQARRLDAVPTRGGEIDLGVGLAAGHVLRAQEEGEAVPEPVVAE
jgi:hypothetical protein